MSTITKFPIFKEYCIACKKLLKNNRKWILWCNGCNKKGMLKANKILEIIVNSGFKNDASN